MCQLCLFLVEKMVQFFFALPTIFYITTFGNK